MHEHKHKNIYVDKKQIQARFPYKSGYKEIMANFTREKCSEENMRKQVKDKME